MELALIAWLREQLAKSTSGPARIGDDAAILPWPNHQDCIVTTDLLADRVHFQLAEAGPELCGRKAVAVNLSDLAAMAACPIAVFVSLLLPRDQPIDLAQDLMRGMFPLADRFQASIAGGDTNVWDGPLVVNVTALGMARPGKAWMRGGVQPGDLLMATGPFGGSLAGHHLTFTPRVTEALYLADHYDIHAAIDVSDGLALDVWRLAQESGCGVELDLAAIPIRPAAGQAASRPPLQCALEDGEDFELVLSASPDEARRVLEDNSGLLDCHVIGRAIDGSGLWGKDADGQVRPLAASGFVHR